MTLSSTAPVPAISRPAAAAAKEVLTAIMAAPNAISTSPASTTRLAPNRCPKRPPGIAMTTPGNI
jgi:hypothetical protein